MLGGCQLVPDPRLSKELRDGVMISEECFGWEVAEDNFLGFEGFFER